MKVGVLALQGGYDAHLAMLQRCGVQPVKVRTRSELATCEGLILPGGESTTIGLLLQRFHLGEAIIEFAKAKKPIWGTCAGMILLSKEIQNNSLGEVSGVAPLLDRGIQFQDSLRYLHPGGSSAINSLGLLDVSIQRNAFGRQIDSFVEPIAISGLSGPLFPAVFIRAPLIKTVSSKEVEVLATFSGRAVMVKQGSILASAFHPELCDDVRVHEFFIKMIADER